LPSGSMRRLVELQTPTRVPDADGGFTETWTPEGKFWAEFAIPSAANVERVIGGEAQGVINFVVRAYYNPAATITSRLVDGAHVYDVRGVRDVDDRHQWMELAVEEHV
jgi:head-tail adaptor